MIANHKLPQLHAIRGLAALYVLVTHAKFILWSGGRAYIEQYPRADWGVFDYLLFGVDLFSSASREMVIVFFTLSGFFMMYSFEKNKWSLKDFYLNRIVRIYVPYLGSIIFSGVVVYLLTHNFHEQVFSGIEREFNLRLATAAQDLSLSTFFYTLFFMTGDKNEFFGMNIAYWSLYIEAIYYLILPWVVTRHKWFLGFTVITYFATIFLKPVNTFIYFNHYAIFFAIGMSFYQSLKSTHTHEFFQKYRFLTHAMTLFAVLSASVAFSLMKIAVLSYLAAALVCVLAMARFTIFDFQNNLFMKFSIWLGEVSYSIYLFHFPILASCYIIICKIRGDFIFYDRVYMLASVITLLLASLTYYVLEKPSVRWIQNMKKRRIRV